MRRLWLLFFVIAACIAHSGSEAVCHLDSPAAQFDQKLIQGMKWRLVGPFRGGRALAVQGVVGDPNVYYMGAVAGGVWKTADGGNNWTPLFEKQSVSSIGSIAVAPSNHNVVYVGSGEACIRGDISYGDGVYKSTDGGKTWKNTGLRDTRHIGAVIVDPANPDVLYTAAQYVFKSTDHGSSWKAISGDLTRNDKSRQRPSGGPLTKDITSVEYYDTVFALAESQLKRGMLWAGTDDGLVHLTVDDGQNWTNVTPSQLPEWSIISSIEPSPHDAGSAFIAVDRHKLDDYRPYIYRTADYGKSWSTIVNGIPQGTYVHAVREDPKRKGLLFAGTETGVFFSPDEGEHWQAFQLNLPTAPIHDLVVKNDDLIVATHGRSFWVLDDLAPLRQLDMAAAGADMLLFAPESAIRLHYPDEVERRRPVGDNPPPGAIIDYYFKTAPKDEVTLQIFDSRGKLVRTLSSVERQENEQPPEWPDQVKEVKTIPSDAGMNRCVWNLRFNDPIKVPPMCETM